MRRGKEVFLGLTAVIGGCLGCFAPQQGGPLVAAPPSIFRLTSDQVSEPPPPFPPESDFPPKPAISNPVQPAALDTPKPVDRSPAEQMKELRRLHKDAVEQYATMESYIARLRRREQENGKDKPEEIMLFKFRKEPWSVAFKWLGDEGKGREVVYVKGQYGNKLHTRLAAGDNLLIPAGSRFAVDLDSPLVRAACRHSITEAGIGFLIDGFGTLVEAAARDGAPGTLTYLGESRQPELANPGEAVEQIVPPRKDPLLPNGGHRLWLFDHGNHLPVMVKTYDERKQLVEYYCFDRLQYPVKLDDNDFNPDKLWGRAKP
jgi:hypothetical protein